MRRLTLLPCPESWERMRPDGDGRFCERCSLRVTEVARLDDVGVAELVGDAETGRVCARVELDGGRPRTASGLAAGLMIAVLATGCASAADSREAELQRAEELRAADARYIASLLDPDAEGAVIAGIVRRVDGMPYPNAVVVLMSTALPVAQERLTDERGVYMFEGLPPGNYTIQVLAGKANVSKITQLPESARFRANFSVDTERETDVVIGMIVEKPMIDYTSPASTYSSRMIEYD